MSPQAPREAPSTPEQEDNPQSTNATRQPAYPLLRLLIVGVIAILACLAVAYSTPGKSSWLPPCVFHRLTGLHCPGCGNTRALHALLHGHLLQSLRFNLLLIPGLSLLAYLFAKPKAASNPRLSLSVCIIMILFFVLRNIPVYPFTLLAPFP